MTELFDRLFNRLNEACPVRWCKNCRKPCRFWVIGARLRCMKCALEHRCTFCFCERPR
jgi:hypothetical protein